MAIIDAPLDEDFVPEKDETKVVTLEEAKSKGKIDEENSSLYGLVNYVQGRFSRAKAKRQYDESRWLLAYDNYRGIYGPSVQFRDTEQSRAFVKITKTKVLAATAQMQEILFANNKFPIGIEPSPVPEGIAESVHFDMKSPEAQMSQQTGAPPKTPVQSATISRVEILKQTGYLQNILEPVKDQLKEGPGKTPTSSTWEPAKEAAHKMEKKIQDQLLECSADKSIRSFIFDMACFGTGVFKGPFLVEKEYAKWNSKGVYEPLKRNSAEVSYVSIWDAYPDPDARNMAEAEHFIQRHRLSKSQLRELKKRPSFRKESIEDAIAKGALYQPEYWEDHIQDSGQHEDIDRYEVLEFWGAIDPKLAEDNNFKIPEELSDKDSIQINTWICNGVVIRLLMNVFTPARIPYYMCPYELNPYSIFGIGIAENMEDTQLLMNGFMRLAVDNAVRSANVILEINTTNLRPGQDTTLYPGKVFETEAVQPGTTINAVEIPNRSQEAMMLFDKARQLADEATGMPSYSHGMSGVMSVGRTASGMSMLMGAAKENIKAVVKNIDDYLLVPLGKAMFAFNMQFNFDADCIGDLEVVARGTESLMRDEVRSQKLLQFLQVTNNPSDMPFVKRDYALREIAASMDLEPDKLVNDPREAAVQAELIKQYRQMMGIPPEQDPNAGGGQGAPGVSDPTGNGGGNIAPGMSPEPGAAGFTGAGGGSANAAAAQQKGPQ